MCGRYALFGPVSRHRKNRPIDELPPWYPGLVDAINARPMRFNVAPTDVMPIVGLNREGGPSIRELRWGLVPYWAKDVKIGYKAINARAETVDEKPMFREAFKRRRCLVPASGYFEWKPEGAAKQPYFIHDADGELLMFAGLWESWRETKESDPLYTYTIVTGSPGLVSGDIHDRAPVILEEGAWESWLTGEPADALDVLKAAKEPRLTYYPVPKAVGSPKNDVPNLVGAGLKCPHEEGNRMLEGSCHCGAVKLRLPSLPTEATSCNCSLCRRNGGPWVYFEFGTVEIQGHPENTTEYIQGDRTLKTIRCRNCGCVTHWEPLEPKAGSKQGVHLGNFDPALIASVRVRKFDGAVTWKFFEET